MVKHRIKIEIYKIPVFMRYCHEYEKIESSDNNCFVSVSVIKMQALR